MLSLATDTEQVWKKSLTPIARAEGFVENIRNLFLFSKYGKSSVRKVWNPLTFYGTVKGFVR